MLGSPDSVIFDRRCRDNNISLSRCGNPLGDETLVSCLMAIKLLDRSKIDDLPKRVQEFLSANTDKLKKWYSDSQLNEKLGKVARSAGAMVVFPVVLLYNMFKSPTVQPKDKVMILASLAYFILPTDIIPDFIAGLGFADDGLAVMASIKSLMSSITPDMLSQTKADCASLIGEVDDASIQKILSDDSKETDAELHECED